MTELICMRGLPGSGKSTIAQQYVKDGHVRVSRDDLRASLFSRTGILAPEEESLITALEREIATQALTRGRSVVVDALHLRNKYLRSWNEFANDFENVNFKIRSVYTHPDECVERDSARTRSVGEEVIRDLAQKFFKNDEFPRYEIIERSQPAYVNHDPSLPSAYLCDIDGTMALMDGRSPYDWARVGEDKWNFAVVDLVNLLIGNEQHVIFLSGRDGSCFNETFAWLQDCLPYGYGHKWHLLMREAGDMRKDAVVKREIFDREIRGKYNIQFVLDDRDQVVKMWRRELGLDCFQVAEGAF